MTNKQLHANRLNAQKSTGPVSPEGKAAVARNALKSGIYAKSLITRYERQEDLDTLKAEYYHEYQPTTVEARSLVDELVLCEWRLRRFAVIETEIFANHILGEDYVKHLKAFTALQRQINATRRERDRAFQVLREIAAATQSVAEQTQPSAASPGHAADPTSLFPNIYAPLAAVMSAAGSVSEVAEQSHFSASAGPHAV
jgi:hypothetical protein